MRLSKSTLVLILLVVQTTTIVLLMRYSKSRVAPPYLSSVAVLLAEAFKLPVCVVMTGRGVGWRRLPEVLRREVIFSFDSLRCAAPALAFTLQGNLLFLALTNLEAPTYQVAYQSKTLFTALFSRVLLSRHLKSSQWTALFLLCVGTLLVSDISKPRTEAHGQSPTVGLMAVLGAAVLSASASVYFEKLLKRPRSEERGCVESSDEAWEEVSAYMLAVEASSLWIRNIQLGCSALPLALCVALYNDGAALRELGALQGMDATVWLIVLLNGCGGLLVAATMKYADNIVKCFAAAVAILCGTLLSVPIFRFSLSGKFVVGALVTGCATVLYTSAPPMRCLETALRCTAAKLPLPRFLPTLLPRHLPASHDGEEDASLEEARLLQHRNVSR